MRDLSISIIKVLNVASKSPALEVQALFLKSKSTKPQLLEKVNLERRRKRANMGDGVAWTGALSDFLDDMHDIMANDEIVKTYSQFA